MTHFLLLLITNVILDEGDQGDAAGVVANDINTVNIEGDEGEPANVDDLAAAAIHPANADEAGNIDEVGQRGLHLYC